MFANRALMWDFWGMEKEALKPCPFCGDEVEITYEPVTAYSINCCVGFELQICNALEDEGCRWDADCKFDEGQTTIFQCGEYTEKAKEICKRRLAKIWNQRAT